MLVSETGFRHPPDKDVTPSTTEYKYDLRLEIGVKEEGGTVPVASIFRDLVVKLRDAAGLENQLVVSTIADKEFSTVNDLSGEEFKCAFCVDTVEGKVSKKRC